MADYAPPPPRPKPQPVARAVKPRVETQPVSVRSEPPPGYRFRVDVPPPAELGIVLPE